MTVKKGQILEIEISDMAFGGRGFAKHDELAIFVEGAVPHDRAMVRIIRKKKNYAEAKIVEIIQPSSLRVDPPCPYSGFCGGCTWQFLNYDRQLYYKQQHVIETLEHIALIRDIRVNPTIASENIFGYRNKMEFSCSDRKWLMPHELGESAPADPDFALGLHVPGTFHKVLDIRACLLQPETGNRILEDAKAYMKDSGLPAYGLKTHQGFWRFLMLRSSAAYRHWMVNIITASENRNAIQPLADMLMAKYPEIVSVVNNITARKSGVAVGEYEIPICKNTSIRDRIGQYEFEISANSFFQTNTRGAERLYEIVKNYAELSGRERVWDLYCGTGTIAISLSDAASEIIGIEIIESAIHDARRNCEINKISNCRFVLGDIKDTLPQMTHNPDVVILDPPRVGMHKDVLRQIMLLAPPRLVYVSCNPATLARDLAILKDSYHIVEVQPVDMFPHTFHIESVAKLERR